MTAEIHFGPENMTALAEKRGLEVMKNFMSRGFSPTPDIVIRMVQSAYAQGFIDAGGIRSMAELEKKVDKYLASCRKK